MSRPPHRGQHVVLRATLSRGLPGEPDDSIARTLHWQSKPNRVKSATLR